MTAKKDYPQPLESTEPGWNTLPPRAALVSSAKALDLNGNWRFRWLPKLEDKLNPPSFSSDHSEFIPVPASFVMPHLDEFLKQPHGLPAYTNVNFPFPIDVPFPPDQNGVGEYERDVSWPTPPERAYLRFEGIEGAADIWWNGNYVGSTRGSRLPSEFDLSGLVKVENKLSVRVYTFSAASYVEDQDEWWLPGIIRNVTLIERPQLAIDDVAISTTFENGVAKLMVIVNGQSSSSDSVEINISETNTRVTAGAWTEVSGALPWSAETPNLYTLNVKRGDGVSGEEVKLRFGFRSITIENSRFLVNGSPVQFRGVNRHEHHPLWGRAVPEETVREELALMKRSNINAIRTSHYPPSTLLLDLADEMGFWVIDECDLETHGFGVIDWENNPTNDPAFESALVSRARAMVERDKNHPCVVIWSLGNEAGVGKNLGSMAKEIKSIDSSRPLHYEGDQDCQYVDMWSMMYASVDFVEKVGRFEEPALENKDLEERRRKMPFVLCEYAHAMGTGPGGLSEYQDLFDNHPRLIGGFIWEWLEHGIFTKQDGKTVTNYGGDFGEIVHDGNFVIDGLVSADRKPRSQLYDLARVFAPVRMKLNDDASKLMMISRLDHSDTKNLSLRFEVRSGAGVVETGEIPYSPIAPRGEMEIELPNSLSASLKNEARVLTIWLETIAETPGVPSGWTVATVQAKPDGPIFLASSNQSSLTDSTVTLKNAIDFDTSTGAPTRIWNEQISNWALSLWRAPTDNDLGAAWDEQGEPAAQKRWKMLGLDRLVSRLVSIENSLDTVLIKTRVGAASTNAAVDCSWMWTLSQEGLTLELKVDPVGNWPKQWSSHWARVGIEFTLSAGENTRVSWFGKGPGQSYPDTGQGTRWGWFSSTIEALQERTVRPQESSRRAEVLAAEIGSQLSARSQQGVGMTIRPWSTAWVAKTTHDHLLPTTNQANVVFDFACSGVGTAACGPGVLPAYRLPAKPVQGRITFTPPGNGKESS